jgi:hypothetical protein
MTIIFTLLILKYLKRGLSFFVPVIARLGSGNPEGKTGLSGHAG